MYGACIKRGCTILNAASIQPQCYALRAHRSALAAAFTEEPEYQPDGLRLFAALARKPIGTEEWPLLG